MRLTGLSAIETEEVYLAELLNTYNTMVASKNQPSYKWLLPDTEWPHMQTQKYCGCMGKEK